MTDPDLAVLNKEPAETSAEKNGSGANGAGKTEAALAKPEVPYRPLLEQLPAVLFMVPLNGTARELYVSPHIKKLLGFSAKEWRENPALWSQQLHPEDRERWLADLARTQNVGDHFRSVYRFLDRDGHVVWVRAEANVVGDEAGHPLFLQGVAFDVTEMKEAEAKLRSGEAWARSILEHSYHALIAIDAAGVITDWNPPAELTFGWSRDEILGRPVAETIIPPQYRELHKKGLECFLATGEGPVLNKRIEITALHRDGREFPIELTISPIRIGESYFFSAFIRDITERKETEEQLRLSEERARLTIDTAFDAHITIEARGLISDWNPQAEHTFGWTRDEIIGRSVADVIIPPQYRESHNKGLQRFLTTGEGPVLNKRIEITALHRDGHEFPVEMTIAPIRLGETYLFSAFIKDITERKQAEEKLKQLNANLALARDQALEANRAKSAFLANMSHELRTPLNAIIGFSEMLQEDAVEGGHQSFLPDLQKIHGSAKHLLSLIGGILDLSKIEAGRMELFLETFDLATVIQEVVTTVQPLIEKNGNALEVVRATDLGSMRADVTKVRQILLNLLSNAAKFTEKGTITLEASRVASPKPGWIHVSVRDTGIGMTLEQKNKLFQSFAQGDDSTTRKFGGTGLGLTICERFCEMMGGTITVESELGKGSTFTVQLPIEVGAAQEESSGSDSPTPSPRPAESANSVLVIDDDSQVLELTRRSFIKEQWRVVTAASVEEGLRRAKELLPAAITVSLAMADKDGWEVLMALQADSALADIPVILFALKTDAQQGYALGARHYLTKPVDGDRLASLLQKYQGGKPLCQALIIDDDASQREGMGRLVAKEGWSVSEAADNLAAMKCLAEVPPDLILLDLMLESDALELVRILRNTQAGRSIPVVMIAPQTLTVPDRSRLNGSLQRILQKTSFSREELLQEVRSLVAPCMPPRTPELADGMKSTESHSSPGTPLAVQPVQAAVETQPILKEMDTEPLRTDQAAEEAVSAELPEKVPDSAAPAHDDLRKLYDELLEEAKRVQHLLREQQQSVELLRAECNEAWTQLAALRQRDERAEAESEVAVPDLHNGLKQNGRHGSNGDSHQPDGNREIWHLVYEKEAGEKHTLTGSSKEIREWLQKGLLDHPARIRASRPGTDVLEPLTSYAEFRDLDTNAEPAPSPPETDSSETILLGGESAPEAKEATVAISELPPAAKPLSPVSEAVIAIPEHVDQKVKPSLLDQGQRESPSSEPHETSERSPKPPQEGKETPEWVYWLILIAFGAGTAIFAGHYLFPVK